MPTDDAARDTRDAKKDAAPLPGATDVRVRVLRGEQEIPRICTLCAAVFKEVAVPLPDELENDPIMTQVGDFLESRYETAMIKDLNSVITRNMREKRRAANQAHAEFGRVKARATARELQTLQRTRTSVDALTVEQLTEMRRRISDEIEAAREELARTPRSPEEIKRTRARQWIQLVADGAVQKLEDLVPELEAHFGAGCASAAAGVEAAAKAEADFLAEPATARMDGSTTLCLVKPSAMEHLGLVIDGVQSGGFEITGAKSFALDRVAALEFYEVYRGVAPEFSMMVDEITSGAFVALEIAGDGGQDAVASFRELAGPVDPEMARAVRPESLRAKFGFDKVRNAVHCTDLPEDGALETHYFFKILQEAA